MTKAIARLTAADPVLGKHIARIGQVWAPYRSTAALYLWRAADFPK